eukprot:COSAG01_NODE_35592_length_529_cov_8.011628_1_plen_73_part_10
MALTPRCAPPPPPPHRRKTAFPQAQAAAAIEESVVQRQWHAELAGHAALGTIVGRLDALLDAWDLEEVRWSSA